MMAQCSPPPSEPAKSAFLRLRAIGREEFVVGPIAPLSRHLVAIHIDRLAFKRLRRNDAEGLLEPLLTHPLLRVRSE